MHTTDGPSIGLECARQDRAPRKTHPPKSTTDWSMTYTVECAKLEYDIEYMNSRAPHTAKPHLNCVIDTISTHTVQRNVEHTNFRAQRDTKHL